MINSEIFHSLCTPTIAFQYMALNCDTGLNNCIGPIALNCLKWASGNRVGGLKFPTNLCALKIQPAHFFQRQADTYCTPMTLDFEESWWLSAKWPDILKNIYQCVHDMISSPLHSTTWWSWNGNIFHVTGLLWEESTGHRLNKQWSCRWFEMPWCPCDVTVKQYIHWSYDQWGTGAHSTNDISFIIQNRWKIGFDVTSL